MPFGPFLDFGAGLVPAVDEVEQPPDLFDGKAKRAGSQDKAKPQDVGGVINPVAGGRPRRIWHQADLFIVEDGFQITARPPRQFGTL